MIAYVVSRVVHGFGMQLKELREIGSYELLERIGQGGMGEVWRARHRLLARPAAIKLIRADILGSNARTREAFIQRFGREARETARLGSTHTIDVYDFGVTENGDFYYVMELLEGVSLERYVQLFGPMEPARVIYVLRQTLPFPRRSARTRARSPRRQAGEYPAVPAGARRRLCQGARFRSGQAARRDGDDAYQGGCDRRYAGSMAPKSRWGAATSTAAPTCTRWDAWRTTC